MVASIVSPLGLSLIQSSDWERGRAACTLSLRKHQHALAAADAGTESSFLVVSANVKLIHNFMGNVNAFLHHTWKLSQNSTIFPPILCSLDRSRAEHVSDENLTGPSKPAIWKGIIFQESSKTWEVERISWSSLPAEPRLSPLSSESLSESHSQEGGVLRGHLMQSTWRTLKSCYTIPRKYLSRLSSPHRQRTEVY